jgi:hypothetical protein
VNPINEIRLDPLELVDRVDEMLAWLAIASQSNAHYVKSHFMRADPVVSLGGDRYGELMPNSVTIIEEGEDELYSDREWNKNALTNWLSFTPRVAYARLVESSDSLEEHPVLMQTGNDGAGDAVEDLELVDEYGSPSYIGVRYALSSVGDESKQTQRLIASRAGLPQTARVFRTQDYHVFEDGRGRCHTGFFAAWNGKFYDLRKRPLGFAANGDAGNMFSPELLSLTNALADAFVRDTSWTVELSLSKDRTGVGLRTDAIGAREIVNVLRAADSSAGRRKSIVHWVSEHMRKRRRLDPSAAVQVAAHLRGVSGLNAGRYHVRVWPATSAIRQAKNGKRYDLEAVQ